MTRAQRLLAVSLMALGLSSAGTLLVSSPALAAFPEAPITEAPSLVTATTATFNGELNPGVSGERVSYRFLYAPGGECGGFLSVPSEPPFPEAEGAHQTVSLPVTGLEGSTTYHVCLFATNPLNEAEATLGSSEEFTTPASKPVIVSETTIGLTPFAASLQAEVNPENEATSSCVFEYGKVLAENKLPCEQLELSGLAPQTATRALAGLSPATHYHYRVIVKNATGETKGTEQSFETLAAEKPAVASEGVSAVTPVQAHLEGLVNPNYQQTKCDFSYGVVVTENEVGCEPGLLEGFGEQGVGVTIAGLAPGTAYHYRVLARNAAGETEGPEQEFTTLALEAPIFASQSATVSTPTDAQLEARVNPDVQESSVRFEYATSESVLLEGKGAKTSAASLPAVFEEVTAGPIDLEGTLTPATTYFYRVLASNGTGETTGPIAEFATPPLELPIVNSETATAITEAGVSFEANINPNHHEATYSFQYATDEAFTENVGSVSGENALPAVNAPLPTGPIAATGLEGATFYYYRVVASNPVMGSTAGPTQHFQTLGRPAVTTGAAQEPTRTTATVTGTINPAGASTTYHFLYVSQAGYQAGSNGCTAQSECAYAKGQGSASLSLGSTGHTAEPITPLMLEELAPGTTYHYALAATSSTGTAIGSDQTFTTAPATPPTATTGPATAIGQFTATIAGTIDTRGLPTTIQIEIAIEPTAGSLAPATITSQSGTISQVTATLQGLQPGATYYYRMIATNPDGTTESTQATFTTTQSPATITPPPTLGLLPFTTTTTLTKPTQETINTSHPSRARELAKALKACHKKHGQKRARCERHAHQKYGRAKHKK